MFYNWNRGQYSKAYVLRNPLFAEKCYNLKKYIFHATREKLIENCVMYINFRK
jgi:hypothetical protein